MSLRCGGGSCVPLLLLSLPPLPPPPGTRGSRLMPPSVGPCVLTGTGAGRGEGVNIGLGVGTEEAEEKRAWMAGGCWAEVGAGGGTGWAASASVLWRAIFLHHPKCLPDACAGALAGVGAGGESAAIPTATEGAAMPVSSGWVHLGRLAVGTAAGSWLVLLTWPEAGSCAQLLAVACACAGEAGN